MNAPKPIKSAALAARTKRQPKRIVVRELRVEYRHWRTDDRKGLQPNRSIKLYDLQTDKEVEWNLSASKPWMLSFCDVLDKLDPNCIVQVRAKAVDWTDTLWMEDVTDARPLPGAKPSRVFFETVLPIRDGARQVIQDPLTKKSISRWMGGSWVEEMLWKQGEGNVPVRVISRRSCFGNVMIIGIVGAEKNLPARMTT